MDAAHPLRRTLEAFRQAGARVQELSLGPLARKTSAWLVAESLRRPA